MNEDECKGGNKSRHKNDDDEGVSKSIVEVRSEDHVVGENDDKTDRCILMTRNITLIIRKSFLVVYA